MLGDRIHAFIESYGREGSFEELAAEVFAYQHDNVPLYRRFCQMRGVRPADVRTWSEAPPIPAEAFKHGLIEDRDRPHLFLSSGTTAGPDVKSRHSLTSLDTYRASAMEHFARMVLPDAPGPMATLLLGPSARSHPQSSLGQMFEWAMERFAGERAVVAFDADGRADVGAARAWLEAGAAGSTPVLVLGVTSAITALLDALRAGGRALRLPADSRLVDTGGRKGGGAGRVLSPRGLLKAAWRYLHVPAYMCVNEYGMTEMLSQLYDDALLSRHEGRLSPRAKLGPPWLRTIVVDPATLAPVAAGRTGILRHFDLANWETVSALQTLDLGRAVGRGFEVTGRARGADARGCSQLLATVRDAASSARSAPEVPDTPGRPRTPGTSGTGSP